MRRLRWAVFVALAPMFTVACADGDPAAPQLSPEDAVAAAADVWWESGEEDGYTFEQYVWCLDEMLTWNVSYWYKYHFVVNKNREIWLAQYGLYDDTYAVGESSGLWRVHVSTLNGPMQNERWVMPLGEPFQVMLSNNPRWTFVSEETGETLSFPFRLKVIRNAAGEIKVETYVEPCRIR